MARYVKRRRNGYYLNVPIPAALRARYGGKAKLEETLKTADERVAISRAARVAHRLKLEALAHRGNDAASDALAREEYEAARAAVLSGKLKAPGVTIPAEGGEIELDPVEAAVDMELDALRDAAWARADPADPRAEPLATPIEDARAAGLIDGLRELQGERPAHRHLHEPPFLETATAWLDEWRQRPGRKATNTEGQYRATLAAFAAWWGSKPLRAVTEADAAAYVSRLATTTAGDARHRRPTLASRGEPARPGLTAATIRRHLSTLSQVWQWARPRLGLPGDNPWANVKPSKPRRPAAESLPWADDELRALLVDRQPSRRDVYEACLVALHSGMRASEVANLTWGDVQQVQGVWCFRVADAKTPAGRRSVPVHASLAWMLAQARGPADAPLWPGFNPEGPGKSRGDDLSRLFGRYKSGLGFGRSKTFHSFRKNITERAENLGIPANQWQRIIGHEPGLTFGTYNPHGLAPPAAAALLNRIAYDGIEFPTPAAVYGGGDRIAA